MTTRELSPKPTPDQFAKIARAIDPNAEVVGTRRLIGGVSCRMDAMEFSTAAGESCEVVVRQYGPWHAGEDPHPGTIEATILDHLAENGIPAPTLVLGDEVTTILGTPSIVTSFVQGKPVVNPPDTQEWSAQIADALAKVHDLPISPHFRSIFPPVYGRYERVFNRPQPSDRIAKHPLGTRLWQTMKQMWPDVDKSEDSLLHGDFWAGNIVWRDGELAAIVDWEEPRFGVPAYDVALLVQDATFFGLDVEDAILEQYQRVSGRTLTDFTFWKMIRLLDAMPDPGAWSTDFIAMGRGQITSDEVRTNHSDQIERMLTESHGSS
jgi:aminoglycoside phosphotransferase (APT) family kinase protein